MPTPVSAARQCLTDEATRVLDDAVAVARRRSHSQTTSLHAISALLSLSKSTLRDACARARSSAYSPRLQFRALELCVSVSLDRLPSNKIKSSGPEAEAEPPVSNSLMAAIKRSQANQRRHPETFHLYQMHQQLHGAQSSLSCIKVELKHFVLSILDDPIVSRVFGDAGFRSTDIKIAVLHPNSGSGFQKPFKVPPLFLCNINPSGINFPFAVDQGEEDFKRIGLVLVKKVMKNPLLIGASAHGVVTRFIDLLKLNKVGFLPNEIEGLKVVEFGLENLSEDLMDLKVNEVREKVEGCGTGNGGVIVNFGDLKVFVDGVLLEYVVSQVSDLVRVYGGKGEGKGKLWLIGSVGSYEVYMKILAKFPGLDKEWDLNLLPITSLNPNGSHLKSSLMGSFVPFGGFFPVQTEHENISNSSSTKPDQSTTRCDGCNKKYEQEVSVLMNGGKTISVADQQSTGLASWLQVPETDSTICKDTGTGGVFNARIMGLQRKWSDICHRLHHNLPSVDSQIRARIPFHHGFQPDPNRAETSGQDSNQESRCGNLSPPVDFFASTSLSSKVSITTDLGLGTIYVSPDSDPGPPACETRLQTFNGLGPAEKDFKQLYTTLADKVGYQNDAIRAICQTITRVRTGTGRRYVWFMFSGPDQVGKKKVSSSLSEVVFGSSANLISIDLNFENQMSHAGSVFNRQNVNFSDPSFRGKAIMEFIAEELTKKPQSVVLLEHIDKADFVTKDHLSRAIKTGRLSDARGRETRITDAIFVLTTSTSNKEANGKELLTYSEERILNTQALQMRISVEKTEPGNSTLLLLPKDSIFRNPESKKRKIIEIDGFEIMFPKAKKLKSCFDLNLPLEETEESDNDTVSETKDLWLEEFLDHVDEKVVFEPFDFDSRADTILKEMSKWFEKSFGRNVVLEIENEVMVQIVASDWASDENGGVENWIKTVLYKGFMEVKQKGVDNESVVKLVVVEGVKIEDYDALCVCLPSNIMVK